MNDHTIQIIENDLGARIRTVRGKKSLGEFAETFGIHKNTLARYERGISQPDCSFITEICDLYSIDPSWMLTGKGEMRMPENTATVKAWNEFIAIPRDASCTQNVDKIIFNKNWLENQLSADIDDLFITLMRGDSMEPSLSSGDILLIDRGKAALFTEGIYLINFCGNFLIKRIQQIPGGKLRISSENDLYETFTVDQPSSGESFSILGRVAWAGKKL